MTKPIPKFRVGDTVRTLYWIPGAFRDGKQEGIPGESFVKVTDVSMSRYGRGRDDWEMVRYRVERGGVSLWVYEDGLEEEEETCA